MPGIDQITASLTATYTSTTYLPVATLGDVVVDAGKFYKFVLIVDADIAINECLYPAATNGNSYTNDFTGGSGLGSSVGAIAIGTVDISAAAYAWVQLCVPGTSGTVRSDGSVAAGESIIGHSVNGEADTMQAGEEDLVFAKALAADSGSPVTCPGVFI